MLSTSARIVLIASITLDISPPEAMRANGFNGSPTFGEIRNSTLSSPLCPYFLPAIPPEAVSNWISTLNLAFFISSSSSCFPILLSRIEAALTRSEFSLHDVRYSWVSSSVCFCTSSFAVSSLFSRSSSCFCASAQNRCISSIPGPYFRLSLKIWSSLSSIPSRAAGSNSMLSLLLLISAARSSAIYMISCSRLCMSS